MNLVKNVYDLRQKFIILGLTGRTGSGCTTVANLLKEGFESISTMPNNDGITNDERKYKIEYNFLKTIWSEKTFKVDVIKASDIIFYYALKESFDDFYKSIFKTSFSFSYSQVGQKMPSSKKHLKAKDNGVENDALLIERLKKNFEKMHKTVVSIEDVLNKKSMRI